MGLGRRRDSSHSCFRRYTGDLMGGSGEGTDIGKNGIEETGNKLQGSDIGNGIEETGNKLQQVRSIRMQKVCPGTSEGGGQGDHPKVCDQKSTT